MENLSLEEHKKLGDLARIRYKKYNEIEFLEDIKKVIRDNYIYFPSYCYISSGSIVRVWYDGFTNIYYPSDYMNLFKKTRDELCGWLKSEKIRVDYSSEYALFIP